MQAMTLRKIKSWLNLPRSFTASALHHPGLIDIPALSKLRTKAKLNLLASVTTSKDPLIQEVLSIATDNQYSQSQKIPHAAVELLQQAKSSTENGTTVSLKTQCKRSFKE